MTGKLTGILRLTVCVLLVFVLVGCGTILYPKRAGQKGGQIDVSVAVMDGLCVLLFVVPGIVAYIVDFSTGCIYLPGTYGSMEPEDMKKVSFDPDNSTVKDIEDIVSKETGIDISANSPALKIYSFESLSELEKSAAVLMLGDKIVLSRR
ncbi:MAG: hypothetical protein CVV21_11275 [Candidatus Goldiibacteriota bacterium HGW-Goldbacteria-1]|jgi:hypothetical protein|nr:MAG: hypothetical protein CVV21_11275 [Candidatus Goldiibacteriota bacterium HGW-Goldbacteria-1]